MTWQEEKKDELMTMLSTHPSTTVLSTAWMPLDGLIQVWGAFGAEQASTAPALHAVGMAFCALACETTARTSYTAAWQAAEFAFDSPRAPADGGAKDYAAHCFAPGRAVLEALLDLNARIRRDFTFRAGVTTTTTRIAEVLRRRFFKPESIVDVNSFRPHVLEALKGVQALDDTVKKEGARAETRYLQSFPFHKFHHQVVGAIL